MTSVALEYPSMVTPERVFGRLKEAGANFRSIFQRYSQNRRGIVALALSDREPNLIDTDTFPYYLRGAKNLVGLEGIFASRLSLKPFTPFFQEMYDTVSEGYFHKEEQRRKFDDLAREIESSSGRDNIVARYVRQLGQRKAIAERARVIYTTPWRGEVKATKIRSGEHTQVKTGSIYFILSLLGRIPLLDVHTHPGDSLFSPTDYFLLLTGPRRYPLVRAAVVLCPTVQILALATGTTPYLQPDKALRFINTYEEDIYGPDRKRIETLRARVKRVRKHRRNKILGDFTQSLVQPEQAEKDKQETRISNEEYESKFEETKKALKPDEIYERRYNRVLKKAEDKFLQEASVALNRRLILFPRLLNIKLYYSIDMQNFFSFSA